MSPSAALPDRASIGREGIWTITDQYGEETEVTGALLGLGSSFRPRHQNHPGTEFAPKGTYCSTCRWTEIRIFAADKNPEGNYLVVTRGASAVPGEKDFISFEYLVTGDEVMEKITTRKGRGSEPYLAMPAARAASQAATFDPEMRAARENSPVK